MIVDRITSIARIIIWIPANWKYRFRRYLFFYLFIETYYMNTKRWKSIDKEKIEAI